MVDLTVEEPHWVVLACCLSASRGMLFGKTLLFSECKRFGKIRETSVIATGAELEQRMHAGLLAHERNHKLL